MSPGTTGRFGERLNLALKTVNLSPAALGAAVGVDKSVVSRWLAGKVRPSGHNLTRIAIEIARHRPGFTTLAFDGPDEAFVQALNLAVPLAAPLAAAAPDTSALPVPYGLVNTSRNEVLRRGDEYFGHYDAYYWSFTQPGRIARLAVLLRPALGLIEMRYGARGFEFRGWALLLQNRLYVQLAEMRHDAMLYMVTNAGQQPQARLISGIILGPSDGNLMPTASGLVLARAGGISGRPEADDRDFEMRADGDPFAGGAEAPDDVRALLDRMQPGGGGSGRWLFRVPYADAGTTP
ncbi:helix-turn-helix domain-containing protein [Albidovulum sp.]|uniref:helix-turn-helix domain-containing protein n=1 Tax=Albidovulum sp. TaxID=1872424 RepID=UPI0039B834E1